MQNLQRILHSEVRSAIRTQLQNYASDVSVGVHELASATEELFPQIDFIDLLDITAEEIAACGKNALWETVASGKSV
jgi:hypothetical protein